MRIFLFYCLCVNCFFSKNINASFFDRKAEGWHWYEQLSVPQKEKKRRESQQPQPQDPMTQLKDLKQRIERIKAIAVLDPSYENVRSYMTIQKQMMERSAAFSKRWMEVVYTNPNLDETIKNPTAQAARHVFHEQNRKKLEASIAGLAKTHGLFFFFSSNCQYCAEFAPIVQAFSQKYGWEVLAISIDGGTLKEYPSPRFDNGSAKTLGLQSVPALLAIEPKTGQIIPLSFGMSTHDQIEDRIRVLVLEKERNR